MDPDVTLDIKEVQVLVNYPGDADGFNWHHRVLLRRIEGSTWLTLTPDLEIQRHDLSAIPHRVLDRAAPFPADIAGEIYAHVVIGNAALQGYKRQASTMAVILGEGTLPDSETYAWVIQESGRPDFGEQIDLRLLNNEATGLAFATKGVIQLNGEEVFVERVPLHELVTWKKTRKALGMDVRLLGDHRDSSGKRRLDLTTAVSLMKGGEEEDFPVTGTRAAFELHDAVAQGAGNFTSYHSEWVRLSGVSRKSSAAFIHQCLCEMLRLAHHYDQVDSSALASLEHATRWLIQVELAVDCSPQQPNYEGLDIMSGAVVSADGRATAHKFVEWVSSRMKDRANLWRQERLFKEERRFQRGDPCYTAADDDSEEEDNGKGGGKRKKKNKKKKDSNPAAGAAGSGA